jgi:hypothetical protein
LPYTNLERQFEGAEVERIMGSKVEWKLRFWQRSGPEVEEMRFAAAGATGGAMTQPFQQRRITLADDSEGKVELVQVTRSTGPDYRPNSNADILCIDLHEFGIEEAIDWIRKTQELSMALYRGPAVIAVLGDADRLSVGELAEISRRLEPAGAIFRPWPKGCKSFSEAFVAFGEAVARNYRWPAFAVENSLR